MLNKLLHDQEISLQQEEDQFNKKFQHYANLIAQVSVPVKKSLKEMKQEKLEKDISGVRATKKSLINFELFGGK
jgi:hypothetical protein